jgi:hypothetical protein
MPAKKSPPRVSLREWFEQRLEPNDLVERHRLQVPELTLGSDWASSIDPVPPPHPARDRFRALVDKWREACAYRVAVWASRNAMDAAQKRVELPKAAWRRMVPDPLQGKMTLPGGKVRANGRPLPITWFNVEMEHDLIEATERFGEANPNAGYHERVKGVMDQTGATQEAVREALGKVKPQRAPGRPKKQED